VLNITHVFLILYSAGLLGIKYLFGFFWIFGQFFWISIQIQYRYLTKISDIFEILSGLISVNSTGLFTFLGLYTAQQASLVLLIHFGETSLQSLGSEIFFSGVGLETRSIFLIVTALASILEEDCKARSDNIFLRSVATLILQDIWVAFAVFRLLLSPAL
ncbi:hypothetical protein ACJX0J_034005, partial [Zea mays]